MLRYLVIRLLQVLLAVFITVTVVFVLTRVTGDPVLLYLPQDVTPTDIADLRQRLGFDRPIHEQYGVFLWGALRGDFGDSLRYRESAFILVLQRVPATLILGGWALLVTALVSVPLGVGAAIWRGSLFDRAAIALISAGQALPGFWLGLILIWVFAVQLGWFPTGGTGGWRHLVLPVVTLAAFSASRIARVTRTAVLEVINKDYTRTAWAKGLTPRSVFAKHVLKNAAIPIITVFGLDAGALLGGAVVVETIFSWPGMGRYLVDALLARDFPIVIVGVLFTSIIYLVVNLLVDLSYTFIDPRIEVS